ncbi:MAG: NADH:ubiquinone reductase (Na(+)-transporting) subunit B [Deltaproteobacteria bacterium]|nr:NADH:ubiquinone reductase (Na(+)-transporting) subunit B [Deltaproteobacteria bacterium]MCB9490290.1 NADH:ubiquinone reductase (Na(+)-transporting) subunit B [Deltaproteobacteria bacterium]
MKLLRKILDSQAHIFEKGGKLEKLYPLWEAQDTFLYTPGERTRDHGPHVRDALDIKRTMSMVVIALIPCVIAAILNSGYQAQSWLAAHGGTPNPAWIGSALAALGLETGTIGAIVVHGVLLFLPVYIVSMAVGGGLEATFSIIRKHEINEGFLVTGMLYPLVLPPTIPLWQVALGVAFGVVLGKEVFGGTGMNILNPALTARAFLFFAYPAQISGVQPWVAVDGFSTATPLSQFAASGHVVDWNWFQAFIGAIPGSMGETSTFACLIGAAILIGSGIGSWRIMVSCLGGLFGMSLLLNIVGSDTNPFFGVPFYWHLVCGGFAFGAVFMATDPVSAAISDRGKFIYGALIGALCVLVRVLNPAYPEGMMLAILFMNLFSPLIDYFVVKANAKRREMRLAVQQ